MCEDFRELATDLSQDDKARLVGGQPQHDEVGIQAVQAVPDVGVPAGPATLLSDVGHDLVLALPGHICIRQDHLQEQCRPLSKPGVAMEAVFSILGSSQ